MRGVKSRGQSRLAWKLYGKEAAWVSSENVDGRAEKPRYDVPQGVGAKKPHEAELTNQHGGSGEKNVDRCISLYRTVTRNG